jgi:hypothetical protein
MSTLLVKEGRKRCVRWVSRTKAGLRLGLMLQALKVELAVWSDKPG